MSKLKVQIKHKSLCYLIPLESIEMSKITCASKPYIGEVWKNMKATEGLCECNLCVYSLK